MDKQDKQNSETTAWCHQRQRGLEGPESVKEAKYTVMEDLTTGGKHTVQYLDDVSQNRTLEIYIISLTNVTPINSIKNVPEVA